MIAAMAAHFEAVAPREGCGVVVRGERFIPIANVCPRFNAYEMDSKALLAVAASGAQIVAIAHSHVDGDGYFSSEDERMALTVDGEPLWPGVHFLVMPIRSGQAGGVRCYAWSAARRHFVETQLAEFANTL